MDELLLILDFGSQYNQLIVRRVREANVYCEMVPWDAPAERIAALNPAPSSSLAARRASTSPGRPARRLGAVNSDKPILGICYGMQLVRPPARRAGRPGPASAEYGHAGPLGQQPPTRRCSPGYAEVPVWMSHGDRVDPARRRASR